MKKIAYILICLAVILALCACADSEPAEDGVNAVRFSENDMVFKLNDSAYTLKSQAAPLIAVLGADYTLKAAPSCVYTGEDKQYIYEHITIYTYPENGEDMLDEIYFIGGGYKTAKGIGIGATLADIEQQYGTGWFDIDGMIVYAVSGEPDDIASQKLYFELTEGRVSGISYYSASNAA